MLDAVPRLHCWMQRCCWIVAAAVALGAAPAHSVIIDSGDGTGNTTAPPDDPGWDHLGKVGGLSGVYLGNGWMLTANHVALNTVTLAGSTYAPVVGSEIRLSNGDGSFADLKVFALHGLPNLPLLPIRTTTPPIGTPLVMAGRGRDRGAVTSWNPAGPGGPYGGYLWETTNTLRWGTNEVEGYPSSDPFDTVSFYSVFDENLPPATQHEAQAASGDSGGAVWIDDGGGWELAGILFAIESYAGQPSQTSLYGNLSYAADLSFYEAEISEIVALPEPDAISGLLAGGALLALRGRRMRA